MTMCVYMLYMKKFKEMKNTVLEKIK